ncbi:single-stranded DNA-binding protein [Klebsiella pneumoniae]|uniref:single-stranded DNA-binding protein n=1 Tax=Klebsiella pneumoniae TaxID=573 RepID=UPI001012E2F1|nr:single-stranded DNA-binding protein [Klebsiella pneumoniae]HDT3854805.1 single-stranded DNA-binding protein [Klebsiella pneumoniae subsp. pneumoniae]MBC4777817.1 single-stranded DNA-binding protein [Klebsiella pneumoniae]MBC4800030.1 single-stranded DNA-binding protein [Klebsiella pneumoniae]MBC4821297.1 single-stranded DNA-binding protein [Klebsiella pneumoniae]MBC4836518.1 single-stranded DNA-binding protein [Klebsiella pneumoniae]
MTAQISAYGRLVADPQTRTTNSGSSMTMGRLAVALPCHAAEGGEVTFWLGVVAFGKQADALAGHVKGDLVSVAGAMQVNQWTGKDGGTQQGYQVVADSVISAKTVRPGGKRSASAGTDNKGHTTQPAPGWEIYDTPDAFDQRPPFDDETPF